MVFIFTQNAKALDIDKDVPSDVAAQMLDDLNFMYTLSGTSASPIHQNIYGAVDGATYQKFFESRVNSVGYDDCGSAGAVACFIPYYSAKMWITDNFIKFNHPQIARLMVLYHEARHTEYNHSNWSHARCPTPFLDENGNDIKSIFTGRKLQGEYACDITPFGSYGSTTILLKNISNFCSNCSSKVVMDAAVYSEDQLGRIIDKDAKADMINDSF